MPLTITSSEQSAQCSVSYAFNVFPYTGSNPAPGSTGSEVVVRRGDFFGSYSSEFALAIPGPAATLGQALRFSDHRLDVIRNYEVSYPPDDRQDLGDYDWRTYGNVVNSAYRTLLDSLFGIDSPSQVNEHYTRHFNVSGKLRSSSVKSTWTPKTLSNPDKSFADIPKLDYWYQQVQILSIKPLKTANSIYSTMPRPTYDFVAFLNKLRQGYTTPPYIGFGDNDYTWDKSWQSTISNLEYELLDTGKLTVRYHMDCVNLTQSVHYAWDSRLVVYPKMSSTYQTPVVGSYPNIAYINGATTEFYYSNFTTSIGAVRNYPHSGQQVRTDLYVGCFFTLRPASSITVDRYGHGWADRVISNPVLENSVNDFRNAISSSWGDIVPSATFSTVDALGNMEGSVDNNVLQTLVKIPEIVSALPDIAGAVSILGSLLKRDLSFSTLREIFDLATSTHLQASFQWRPYLELLTKYWPVLASVLPHMFDEKHLTVGYGVYRFLISKDLGRSQVQLETRTKVVVDVTLSGLLSASLTLDSVGVLPTVSRVWDLLPFTFMVNWVTGVNKLLRNFETTGFTALVPASYVHSFTLTSPFMEGELKALDASSFGDPPAGLKVYIRDKTLYPPFPRQSRFAFGIPKNYPSVGLLGSLFYQLFLS